MCTAYSAPCQNLKKQIISKYFQADMRFVKKITQPEFGPEILHSKSAKISIIFTHIETAQMH